MRTYRYLIAVVALAVVACTPGQATGTATPANESAAPMSAAQVVQTHSYVSMQPVPRGNNFQVAVVVDIHQPYHMNSHKPLDSYLIPTTLRANLPAGIKLLGTLYPPGRNKTFPFSTNKPLNVYSGTVTLRLRLNAERSARLGAITIPMTLRYQACNNSSCLPPVNIPVNARVRIAPVGAASHSMHREIFARASK